RRSQFRGLLRRGFGPPTRHGLDRSQAFGRSVVHLRQRQHPRRSGLAARRQGAVGPRLPHPLRGAAVNRLCALLFDRRKLAVALLLLAGAAKAQEVACKAVLAGTRALVDATIHGLLDRELLRIVKLGVAGRLTVE